jgi:hypothetical protein
MDSDTEEDDDADEAEDGDLGPSISGAGAEADPEPGVGEKRRRQHLLQSLPSSSDQSEGETEEALKRVSEAIRAFGGRMLYTTITGLHSHRWLRSPEIMKAGLVGFKTVAFVFTRNVCRLCVNIRLAPGGTAAKAEAQTDA